jgi:hypothetical protein
MHYPAVVKAQNLIRAGDIVGAESALVALADEEGDRALVLAMEQLPPKDLLTVIREYDSSKESVLNLLITPAMFARAVVIEKQYKDLTHAKLRGMVNAVLFREDADPVEFLQAIGDLDGGADALADYLLEYWGRVESFVRTGSFDASEDDGTLMSEEHMIAAVYGKPRVEQDEVADSDWMEFTWLLRTACPDLLIEVLTILRARFKAFNADPEGEAEDRPDMSHQSEIDREVGEDRGGARPRAVDPDEESAI